MDKILELTNVVRETAFAIHTYLRFGHFEKVYENSLAHRMRKRGFTVEQQIPMSVLDEDGTVLGDYVADLRVNGELIIEVKAVRTLASEHTAQILGYMRASDMRHGVLINFGSPRLQIRKFIL